MAAAIDKQILDYLPMLGNEEKKSLLHVIKSFLSLKAEQSGRISIEQYNQELDEALERVRKGSFLTQDDVEKASDKW